MGGLAPFAPLRRMMSKEKNQPKGDQPKAEKDESEVAEEEIIDERKILKEAEEREKEIKQEIKEAREEAKEETRKETREKSVRKAPKHGKKYREVATKIDREKSYEIEEAIALVRQTTTSKFDASIELHIRIDKKTENIRGTVNLPGGAAKSKKVIEITEKNADEFIENVKAGKLDFDLVVTTPSMMPKIAQLAKVLGPKGLMPNPKTGTVTEDPKKAAEEFRGGKLEFKTDKSNIVHVLAGRISFKDEDIKANIDTIFAALPKGKVASAYLASSMGPSIRLAIKK